jgi:hypothetical protein
VVEFCCGRGSGGYFFGAEVKRVLCDVDFLFFGWISSDVIVQFLVPAGRRRLPSTRAEGFLR